MLCKYILHSYIFKFLVKLKKKKKKKKVLRFKFKLFSFGQVAQNGKDPF